jgi:hypothetical protein
MKYGMSNREEESVLAMEKGYNGYRSGLSNKNV